MYLSLAVQNSKCFGFGHYRVLQKPLHTKKYLWFEPSCMMLQYKCGFVYISVRYVTYIANFFLKVLVKFWASKVLGFYFFTSIVSNMYIIYILCYTIYLLYLHICIFLIHCAFSYKIYYHYSRRILLVSLTNVYFGKIVKNRKIRWEILVWLTWKATFFNESFFFRRLKSTNSSTFSNFLIPLFIKTEALKFSYNI